MKLGKTDTLLLLSANFIYIYLVILLVVILTIPSSDSDVAEIAPLWLTGLGSLGLYKAIVWMKMHGKYDNLEEALKKHHKLASLFYLEKHYTYQMFVLFTGG